MIVHIKRIFVIYIPLLTDNLQTSIFFVLIKPTCEVGGKN